MILSSVCVCVNGGNGGLILIVHVRVMLVSILSSILARCTDSDCVLTLNGIC